MLRWAFIFLLVSIVAGLLGFTGVAAASAGIAKVLFFIFLSICLLFFAAALFVVKKVRGT
jgi:uncharacterized membrane protein YtjA (UPF0391 family)